MKIVWSPLALERVNEIADYIAEDDVEAARVWLIDVFGAVDRLQRFPESGRIVPEVKRQNIREIIFKKSNLPRRSHASERPDSSARQAAVDA